MNGSWKRKPVIRRTAHNPLLLQLPMQLPFNDISRNKWGKNWIRQVLSVLSSFPINYCYHYIALSWRCTLWIQMLDGANCHEAPWKSGLFTSWLRNGHCMQLAFIDRTMTEIYILGIRLMPFKKSFFNIILGMMLQLGRWSLLKWTLKIIFFLA